MGDDRKKKTDKAESKTTNKSDNKITGKTASKTAGTASKTTSKAAVKSASTSINEEPHHVVTEPTPKIDDQIFIEKMEQSLLALKDEINNNLIASNNDFKEIVEGMDPKDMADIASEDIDRKIIEALGAQELRRLRLIESALIRIKEGKYTYCIKCNSQIPRERLEAIPYALMCVVCKTEEEKRNR